VITAGGILAAVVIGIQQSSLPLSLPLAIMAGAASYTVAILALRVVSADDLRRVRALADRVIARVRSRDG
jgi:hypothetical protein